tara:strand:+ start:320 stop:1027 length:708 start_codon:yes stop_codon:yes gene_type:complete
MNIANYLDSTYLKTSNEADISDSKTKDIVISKINEAIKSNFACIMIRPEFVSLAQKIIVSNNSNVKVGTVIDFPLGCGSTKQKVEEAQIAINNGADDIDFVCDYNAFKRGSFNKFDKDIIEGTKVGVKNRKIIKWIIETGALSKQEITNISKRIADLVQTHFLVDSKNIFIKTSTGYYGNFGATIKDVKRIKAVSGNLQVKASGGVSNLKECLKMIEAGATRIGTSKAQSIFNEK